jgi:radical SAM protein with 4Fe4S-binding SPASM domain
MVTPEIARLIAQAGFQRVSISIDAPQAARHDEFRGVVGAFGQAMDGIAALRGRGVAVQINATVYAGNVGELDDIYALAAKVGACAFHLFVLVPVGCGLELADSQQLTAQQCEDVLEWICRRQAEGDMELKATCAPQYSRVARRWLAEHPDHSGAAKVKAMLRGRGCLGGVGVLFVSHAGEVFPCGYLPQSCGNVLGEGLEAIWRDSPVLASLRDFDKLGGKCGHCDFRAACGGCRARAYATTGDMLSAEPICLYQPTLAKR